MRSLPPLNALRAFEAAARHESFSRAAEELGVSHSAISRHVRGLEARLGVSLFRDQSRGVVLTAEGHHYAHRIAPAFDVIGDATEGLADTPAGRVVINAEPLFAAKVVAPMLADLQADLPEVDLRLIGSTDLADLDRYEADLAIRFAHKGVLDVPADLLSDAPIYPVAAPGVVPGNMLRPEHLQDITRYRDRREDLWPDWVAAAGWEGAALEEEPYRLRASLAIEAVLGGAGLFLAGSDTTRADEVAGRLIRVSDVGLRQGAFYLLSSGASARRKAVRVVRRWLLDRTVGLRGAENQPDG
ncbi:LysR family transcriptional regulator [Tateyamaria sp. SN6-1]|uniref:LysR family transcriptional regulator n=1 Tax=Tateyamaria sp. SN6-1 TaxID=3092148 RepID=UPI0039F48D2B